MAWPAYWPLASGTDVQTNHPTDDAQVAGRERWYAANGGDVAGAFATSPIQGTAHAAGDDMQSAAIYGEAQNYTRGACANFIDADISRSGTGQPYDRTTWAFTDSTFATKAGLNAAGFTAAYPRAIADATATTYIDGDTPTDGEKALGADGLVYLRSAGAWALAGCCGANKPTMNTVYRDIIGGDYLTPTVWNEIQLAADVLWKTSDATAANTSAGLGDYESRTGGASGRPDFATATADAASDYTAANVTTGTGGPWPETLGDVIDDGSAYGAAIVVVRSKYSAGVVGADLAYTAEVYVYATAYPLGLATSTMFDANGTGLIDSDWVLVDTVGPGTASKTTVFVGNDPNAPYVPNWPADPAGPAENYQGFYAGTSANNQGVLIDWKVAGGFSMI